MGPVRLLLVVLIFSVNVFTQIPKDKILFGAYLGSSNDVNQTHYDFNLPLAAGLNFANQRLIVGIPAFNQATNVTNTSLLQFPYIFAQNDTGGSIYYENGIAKPIVKREPNRDWIYQLTCGYIKKWEAEGDTDFPPGSVNYNAFKLNYGIGAPYQENEVLGWKTGFPIESIEPGTPVHLFTIPKFVMQSRYKYTNKYLETDPVDYRIAIRLRGIGLSEIGEFEDVLTIIIKYYDKDVGTIHKTIIIKKEDITSIYSELTYQFDLPRVFNGALPKEFKVEFIVNWFNRGDIYIDYINIYDFEIGRLLLENYEDEKAEVADYITEIKNQFMSEASFNQKLHFFSGLDEPHSIYSMEPFRIVRQMLSELGVQQEVQTKLYHSFDNDQNNFNTFQAWVKKSNPKSLMYWYYPFYWHDTQEPSDMGNKNALILFMLYRLVNAHKAAQGLNTEEKAFYYVTQSWGNPQTYNEADPMHDGPNPNIFTVYNGWRKPSASELRIQTMAGLAFGAKGIIYEPFYSYANITGIHDGITGGELFTEVQNISARLHSNDSYLSRTLNQIRFNGIYYDRRCGANFINWENNYQWVRSKITNPRNDQNENTCEFTLLTCSTRSTEDSSLFKYFAAQNLRTLEDFSQTFEVRHQKLNSFKNWTVLNLESRNSYSYSNSIEFSELFTAGDAHFYKVGPALTIGGNLVTNDFIEITDGNVTLAEKDLAIPANLTITVNGEYTLAKNIDFGNNAGISGTGFLFRNTGSTITTSNWSKSLFRSRDNNLVKLIWAAYPGEGEVQNYLVYRRKGNFPFVVIATLPAASLSYIDAGTQLLFGPNQSNETTAEYYIEASVYDSKEDILFTDNSNIIHYSRVYGHGLEKSTNTANETLSYELHQNYPNPFNPATQIAFSLAEKTEITLKVYDLLGKEVLVLAAGEFSAGKYSIPFTAANLASSVYIYKLQYGAGKTISKKMTLVK